MTFAKKHRKLALALAIGTGALALGTLTGCQKSEQATPSTSLDTAVEINPVAGIDYKVLQKTIPSSVAKGKVEVLEFFGYWCPHCNKFAPEFEAWRQQASPAIVVDMVPVAFRPDQEPLQRLFFVLHDMKLDNLHTNVFKALHEERVPLFTHAAVIDWAKKQAGVDAALFDKTYQSAEMDVKIKMANQLAQDFELDGVPALGVANKYYVDGPMAKGMARAIKITDHLAAKEIKAQ